jgi:hypothetical protein
MFPFFSPQNIADRIISWSAVSVGSLREPAGFGSPEMRSFCSFPLTIEGDARCWDRTGPGDKLFSHRRIRMPPDYPAPDLREIAAFSAFYSHLDKYVFVL